MLNCSKPEFTGQAEHPEPWGTGVVGKGKYKKGERGEISPNSLPH